MAGDISDVYVEQMPPFDILTGGFPCQAFSARGKQEGFGDPKGQLYHELVRILDMRAPKAFIFENVAALVTMDGGRRNKRTEPISSIVLGETFRCLLDAFQAAGPGYVVSWRIINSRHWLPQMRERVYICGVRADLECSPLDLSTLGGSGDTVGAVIGEATVVREVVNTVRQVLEEKSSPAVARASLTPEQWEKIQSPEFAAKAGRWPRGDGKEGGEGREIKLDGKAPTLTSSYHRASSFSTQFIFEEADGERRDIPRFLTPRECTRVMGFPESFEILGSPERDHHLNRQVGNAVCPPVIMAVGARMLAALEQAGAGRA